MRHPATLSGDMALALPEFGDPPADPIALLRAWITAAEAADVREPRTAGCATAAPVITTRSTPCNPDPPGGRWLFEIVEDCGIVATADLDVEAVGGTTRRGHEVP